MEKLRNILRHLTNLILPTTRDLTWLENASAPALRSKLPEAAALPPGTEAVFAYKHPLMKTAVWAVKYQGNRRVLKNLAIPLYEQLLDFATNEHSLGQESKYLLIPVPMSSQKKRARGYNQCAWLAEELAKLDQGATFELRTDILYKIKNTEAQSHLKRRDLRLANLADSFAVLNQKPLLDRRIILLDDVITTGATTSLCRIELEKAGATKVTIFALAH